MCVCVCVWTQCGTPQPPSVPATLEGPARRLGLAINWACIRDCSSAAFRAFSMAVSTPGKEEMGVMAGGGVGRRLGGLGAGEWPEREREREKERTILIGERSEQT